MQESIWYTMPNVGIGSTFLWVAIWIVWLWNHRRSDWPKAWALALVSLCLFFCGLSRIVHASGYHGRIVYVADWASAASGLVASILVPFAAYAVSRFPTPSEVEHAIRGNLQKREALRQAEEAIRKKENAVRQRDLLLSVIRLSPTLPEDLKAKVNTLIEELENSSDAPHDVRPLHDSARPTGTEPMEHRKPIG